MLTRRLTLAAFAAVFAAAGSLAMLLSPLPASADRDDHRARTVIAANDHDRDDRRRHHHHAKAKTNNGRHLGWNNPHNPHYTPPVNHKPRHEASRDHDHR